MPVIAIKCSESEHAKIVAAAKANHIPKSTWVRVEAIKAAERLVKREEPDE